MARSKNVGRRVALLAVLLGAVALFVAVSIINVTYWYVNNYGVSCEYVSGDT